jgi:hypothetical protein
VTVVDDRYRSDKNKGAVQVLMALRGRW